VTRGALLPFAALAVASCGDGKLGGVSPSGADAGTLTLQASGGPSGSVVAQVPSNEPDVGQQATCGAPVNAGACQLISCQFGAVDGPVPGHGDFGPIFATVGSTTMPITYSGTGYGTVDFPASVALETGGTMRFRGGDGVSVPTFDVAAIIPGVGVITSPAAPTNVGVSAVDTSQDLSVTWQPISIGQIKFQLYTGMTTPDTFLKTSIACTFDGAAGAGVISQALVAGLKEMSGANIAWIRLGSELDATMIVGGLTIVTQSLQSPPTPAEDFQVALQ
jgi:hypothetical protein